MDQLTHGWIVFLLLPCKKHFHWKQKVLYWWIIFGPVSAFTGVIATSTCLKAKETLDPSTTQVKSKETSDRQQLQIAKKEKNQHVLVLLAMNNGMTSCRLHYVVAWIPTTVGVSNMHGLTVMPAEGPTKKDPKKQEQKNKNIWTLQRWTTP